MKDYKRQGTILKRKFFLFLLPNILSTIATSLNEFVDGILVAHLLGSDAMTLVNVGMPVMLIFSMIYTFLGVGGAIIYAEYQGKLETKKAEKMFSITFTSSVIFAVIVMILGLVFIYPLAGILKAPPELYDVFIPYLRVLLISGVLIIPIQVVINFMPALGVPSYGAAINIIANVVNLVMDVVFIKYIGTGLKGASLATLTGYVVGAVVIVFMILLHKMDAPFTGLTAADLKQVPSIIARGSSPAVNQLGYCIKIAFCNNLSFNLAGLVGSTIFAVCMQTVSIASIMIGGIVQAMVPISAALYGQRDYNGIRLLMKTVLRVQFISNLILLIIFELFPGLVLALYKAEGLPQDAAYAGIRIFSVMFVFRGFVLVYMYYFQVLSRKIYALIISLIDGFVGIVPVALILAPIFGLNGMWLTFPVVSILLLSGIIITNLIIASRSEGKYKGVMLYETEEADVPVYDVTFEADSSDISQNTKKLEDFCMYNDVRPEIAMFTAIAAEEMSVIIKETGKINKCDSIDMLVKIYKDDIILDLRSIGKPFDPSAYAKEQGSPLDTLMRIASSVEFSYIMGMNQTRIVLKKNK